MKESIQPGGQKYYSLLHCEKKPYSEDDLVIEIIRIIKKSYSVEFEKPIEDPLGDSYDIIIHIGSNTISVNWHYALGVFIMAENKESDKKLTEVATHVYAELVKNGMVSTSLT